MLNYLELNVILYLTEHDTVEYDNVFEIEARDKIYMKLKN